MRQATDPPRYVPARAHRPAPLLLSNAAPEAEKDFEPKTVIDAMCIHQVHSHGSRYAELAFWIWLGDTPTLFALACCARANRYMAYIWCDECKNHVLDVQRRLVTFPKDRYMPSLVICNSLCHRHSAEDARSWTGPNKRTLLALYEHPRTCSCMPCNVVRFYSYIMP